nr:hypothetical protein [Tanacetum cinerariifolium]
MCHIIGIEPRYKNIIKDGLFVPTIAGNKKLEGQWTGDEIMAANLDQRLKSLIMVMDLKLCYNTFKFKEGENLTQTFTRFKALMNELVNDDFQDSPDDEEDTKSNQEYLNDLEEEYQARSLLAKSKRFFKKGSQRFIDFKANYNKVKAKLALLSSGASSSKSSMVKNKCLVVEAYEWDEEDVSSYDNEITEVKVLMVLNDDENVDVGKESAKNGKLVKITMKKVHTLLDMEDNDERNYFIDCLCIDLNYVKEQRNNLVLKHRDVVQELDTCKEQILVLKQAKLDFLTMQHVNVKILNDNQNLRKELKDLTTITKTWLNSSNKVNQCISEQILTQKKRFLGPDQLAPSSSGKKDLGFVCFFNGFTSSFTNQVCRRRAKLQVKITDPSVAITDSSAIEYDSADESLVCSTPLPPLEKLAG